MRRRPPQLPALPERYVTDPAALGECVEHLLAHSVLGFDTEFVGEETYRPELCLIQVSTPERLYLIDPYQCGPLDPFWAVLHDPNRVTVAHAGREEVRLCRFLSGTPPGNLFDVQIAAGLVGLTYPIGYAGLVQLVVGARLNKGDTLSDWRRRPLTASQIRYAYDDVRFLIPAYERIVNKLKRYDRMGWAEDEFRSFLRRSLGEEVTVERWRKVKGAGGLDQRELAALRAVFEWREGVADRRNRPPRSVLRDDVLLEVARRGARAPDDLLDLRGIPRGEGESIRTAVKAANQMPAAELPTVSESEQDPPQVAILGALLNVVLSELCERLKLAQSLVCSQQDLKDLVRAKQPGGELPDDSPFRGGWRREAVYPHLERILTGDLMVRVQNPASSTPLEYIEPVGE